MILCQCRSIRAATILPILTKENNVDGKKAQKGRKIARYTFNPLGSTANQKSWLRHYASVIVLAMSCHISEERKQTDNCHLTRSVHSRPLTKQKSNFERNQ